MGSIFYVMAIMGCGDGSSQCTEVRTAPVRYASAAQCQAAMPNVLATASDIDFPQLAAACRPAGATLVAARRPAPRG